MLEPESETVDEEFKGPNVDGSVTHQIQNTKGVKSSDEVNEADDLINSSQSSIKDSSLSEKKNPLMARRLAALSKKFDVSLLSKSLEDKPKLGSGLNGKGTFFLNDENWSKKKEEMKNRLVNQMLPAPEEEKEKDVCLTVVRKEVDEEGNEKLKTEEINYHSKQMDFNFLKSAKRSEQPGVQQQIWKQTLREKIYAKKRLELRKREEIQKLENEQRFGTDPIIDYRIKEIKTNFKC